jgi:hypothetical protein
VDEYGRRRGVLHHFSGHIHHLAPIPVLLRHFDDKESEALHRRLEAVARGRFEQKIRDVPDVRHIREFGDPPDFQDEIWSEEHVPAVGVWHRVPVNQFLQLDEPAVAELRSRIESAFVEAIRVTADEDVQSTITESWIQFYRDGDYKVLHNHGRYGPPFLRHAWAGGYYLDDGAPDPTMPYSGAFSFRVRDANYYIRPRPGTLIMWPADILHEVHPFYGRRERIVVNFNISAV